MAPMPNGSSESTKASTPLSMPAKHAVRQAACAEKFVLPDRVPGVFGQGLALFILRYSTVRNIQ
jgi:hypothetical protein